MRETRYERQRDWRVETQTQSELVRKRRNKRETLTERRKKS